MDSEFIEKMRQRLLEEQKNKLEELKRIIPHTEMGTGQDENAEEVEIDEVNHDLAFRLRQDLEKIDKALKKISVGTYGVDDTGQPINPKRLEVLPWADTAI